MSSLFFTVTIETVSLQKEKKNVKVLRCWFWVLVEYVNKKKIPFHHYKPTLKEKIRDIFRKKVKILTNSLIFTNMQISKLAYLAIFVKINLLAFHCAQIQSSRLIINDFMAEWKL